MTSFVGEFFAFASIIAFAFGGVAVVKARHVGPGDGGALLSVFLTAALSGAVWLASGGGGGNPPRDSAQLTGLAWFALSGILSTAAGRSLYFLSVHELGAIRASAVKRTIPFFSVLFGVMFLNEVLTKSRLLGVGLIAISIAALIIVDLRKVRGSKSSGDERVNLVGYILGMASGFSYASSYVARKLGLEIIPDGAFGTFVGAIAALTYYVTVAMVSQSQRAAIHSALTTRNAWAVVAATGFSVGQILNFYAIQLTTVTAVGAIQSLEVFVSMLVATLILRTERTPGLLIIVAAVVATLGVLLVVTGPSLT